MINFPNTGFVYFQQIDLDLNMVYDLICASHDQATHIILQTFSYVSNNTIIMK